MEEMSELSQVCSKLLRLNGIGYKSRMEYEEAEQKFEEEIDDVLASLLFVYNDMHPHDRTNENSIRKQIYDFHYKYSKYKINRQRKNNNM